MKSITDDFKMLHEHQTMSTKGVTILESKLKKMLTQALKDKAAPAMDLTAVEQKIKCIADDFHKGHEQLRQELDDHIKAVEFKIQPLPLVLNTDTMCIHKVLTTVEEAGTRARAKCSWKYALGQFRLCSWAEGEGREKCGTCY